MKRTGKEFRDNNEKKVNRSINRTTLIFAILVLLCLIVIGLLILFVNKETGLDIDENTYQYVAGSRNDHYEPIHLDNSEISTILTEDDEEKSTDFTPIYTDDDDVLYLPISYSYADLNDGSYWRIPEFMKLTKNSKNDTVTCTFNDDSYEISNGFLFDGYNQYIFLEDGTITINGMDKYTVTPFSFFSGDLEYPFSRIYNQKNKNFTLLEDEVSSAIYVSNSGYSIDLIRGIYVNGSSSTLLVASPSALKSIGER